MDKTTMVDRDWVDMVDRDRDMDWDKGGDKADNILWELCVYNNKVAS